MKAKRRKVLTVPRWRTYTATRNAQCNYARQVLSDVLDQMREVQCERKEWTSEGFRLYEVVDNALDELRGIDSCIWDNRIKKAEARLARLDKWYEDNREWLQKAGATDEEMAILGLVEGEVA